MKTKLIVEHKQKPPEKREVEWLNKDSAVVIAVVFTILAGIQAWISIDDQYNDWDWIKPMALSTSLLASGLGIGFIVLVWSSSKAMSNSRMRYQIDWDEVAPRLIAVPWIICYGLIVLLIVLVVLILLGALAFGGK